MWNLRSWKLRRWIVPLSTFALAIVAVATFFQSSDSRQVKMDEEVETTEVAQTSEFEPDGETANAINEAESEAGMTSDTRSAAAKSEETNVNGILGDVECSDIQAGNDSLVACNVFGDVNIER